MPTPDYAYIARLERELGIGQPEPERPIRADPVCLNKDCDGGYELRTWAGQLLRRVHNH
ncbi:hypothetical protein [Streptomyces sp. NPDC088925]|uniref:hypothetical protein n=1 Tax=Streptomyces sp. NPDC088925 TaxID=3365914 RepID=UPI00380A55B3